ncbi:MAG: Na+/H+ antiporter subunit E [Pseudohongiellaceae bacterium]|jgi:multicomponent Na+:H+ antiporter subunit E
MKNTIWLAILLAIFWVINSGHFDALLLSLGALSIILVIALNHLMNKVSGSEQPPVILSWKLPFYVLWLVKEIVKSNIEVIRCIWQRNPAIEPSVIQVKASQESDLFKVLYANSITMTPGTVTMEVEGDMFTIHALTRASREGIESGEMDTKVRNLET